MANNPQQPLFTLPNGELLRPADEAGTKLALDWGATKATAEQDQSDAQTQAMKQKYSGWLYGAASAGIGAVQGAVPGLQSAAIGGLQAEDKLMGTDHAQAVTDYIKGVQGAHPDLAFLGQIAGGVGAGVATGGASAAEMFGVAAFAGAAISADQLALEHAQTPEGNEKLLATLGTGAIAGLVLHGAATSLAPALKATAATLQRDGGDMLLGATLPKGAQEWLSTKSSLGKAQSYLVDNDLVGKSQSEVMSHLDRAEAKTHAVIKEARAATKELTLTADEKGALARQMQQQLASTPSLSKGMRLFNPKTPANLEQLQNLRMDISSNINWKDPSSAYSQRLMNARETVSGAIDSLFTAQRASPELQEQGQRWAQANAEYSTVQDLREAYKAGGSATTPTYALGTLRSLLKSVGDAGMTHGALGVPGVGPAGVVLKQISSLPEKLGKFTPGGTTVSGLGKFLQAFDEKVVSHIQDGLAGKFEGGSEAAVGRALMGLPDYENLAITLHLMNQQPVDTVPRLAQVLQNHGVPGPLTDLTSIKAAETTQLLAAEVKSNPWIGQVVAPVNWPATLKEKAQLLDKANTLLDPLSAIRTPSDEKLALLGKVYPELLNRIQTVVAQEAASRPMLSRAGRQWASKITGIANSPINDPTIQSTLRQLDQQDAAKRQQAQQQTQGKQPTAQQPPPGQTRYQQLMK